MNKYGSDMDFNLIFQVTRYLFRIFRVEKLICMKKPCMKVANTSNVENLVLHYFLKSTFTRFTQFIGFKNYKCEFRGKCFSLTFRLLRSQKLQM